MSTTRPVMRDVAVWANDKEALIRIVINPAIKYARWSIEEASLRYKFGREHFLAPGKQVNAFETTEIEMERADNRTDS